LEWKKNRENLENTSFFLKEKHCKIAQTTLFSSLSNQLSKIVRPGMCDPFKMFKIKNLANKLLQ